MSYAQVAGAVGIFPIRQVSRDLQRYASFGYVRRWKAAGKYRYEITRRGSERLAFFNRRTRRDTGASGHRKDTRSEVPD
jgi:hypothetical protein